MKKVDLIHVTILIIALLTGYTALLSVIAALSYIGYGSEVLYSRSNTFSWMIYYLVHAAISAGICILLVRNARKYARLLLKDEPEASWESTAELQLDRKNILLVLFVGMGLYTLTSYLPLALEKIWQAFSERVGRDSSVQVNYSKTSLATELLRVTFGFFLVFAAPTLSNFLEKLYGNRLKEEQ